MWLVLVRVLQSTEPMDECMCGCVLRTGSRKCRGWQVQNLQGRLDTQGRAIVANWVQRLFAGRIPSSFGKLHLFLLRPSIVWTRPSYIMEGNLPYLKSTDLNVIFIKNTFTGTSGKIVFDQIFDYFGPAKLTHKLTHHMAIPYF